MALRSPPRTTAGMSQQHRNPHTQLALATPLQSTKFLPPPCPSLPSPDPPSKVHSPPPPPPFICRKFSRTPPTSARSAAAKLPIDLNQVIPQTILVTILPLLDALLRLQLRRDYLEAMVDDPFRCPLPPPSPSRA